VGNVVVGWNLRPCNRDKLERKGRVGYYWKDGLHARIIGVEGIN
jgi:hypothetical protein